jgi:hypothetical protein
MSISYTLRIDTSCVEAKDLKPLASPSKKRKESGLEPHKRGDNGKER